MVEIDPLTGLPKELLAMEDIVREQQSIKVHVEKRRYGKLVTVIDGMGKSVDINDLAKFDPFSMTHQYHVLTQESNGL